MGDDAVAYSVERAYSQGLSSRVNGGATTQVITPITSTVISMMRATNGQGASMSPSTQNSRYTAGRMPSQVTTATFHRGGGACWGPTGV